MKIMLRARGLCDVVEFGEGDCQDDHMAMEAILRAVPSKMIATAQQLRKEFETISFRDGETVDDFAMRLTNLVTNLAILGETIEETKLIMPTLGWRWLLALSALPSSLLLIFYRIAPESPRYLCTQGRISEAHAILEKVARMNKAELPSGNLVSDRLIEQHGHSSPSEGTRLISPRHSGSASPISADSVTGGISSVRTLLSPKLMKTTILLWVVFFGNAFSYYGLVLLTTELSTGRDHCMPTSLHSEKSRDISYKDVFITSFAEFPGLLISAFTIDKFGRKFSMSAMFFLCCIFLLPLIYTQSQALTTGLLFGARICISATFTVVYIYAPEVYPTSIRTTGVGIASSVGRIGGMVCPLVAVGLVHGCHQTASIVLFEVVVFCAGICVLMFPFETRGQELSDSLSSSPKDANELE